MINQLDATLICVVPSKHQTKTFAAFLIRFYYILANAIFSKIQNNKMPQYKNYMQQRSDFPSKQHFSTMKASMAKSIMVTCEFYAITCT